MKTAFLGKIKDLFLFFSAFVPMYILILIKLVIDIVFKNNTINVLNFVNIITLLMFIVCGILGIFWNLKKSNITKKEIIVASCENLTAQHFLGYFSLFVLFALSLDLTFVSGYCTYVVIIIFIGIVYIKNALFYINPLLNILGYSFFDITYIENGLTKNAKVFSKTPPKINQKYMLKYKNENFSFIFS